jgi:hypothetical protein
MGNLSYNVANSSNWVSVWSGSFTAPSAPGSTPGLERYYPLTPIVIPVLLDSELIAFYTSSASSPDHWHYAGTVAQRVVTGLTVGGGSDAVVSRKKIYLKEITLLRYLLEYGSAFSLTVSVPYWIRSIDINCWSYIGNINDSYQQALDTLLVRTTP